MGKGYLEHLVPDERITLKWIFRSRIEWYGLDLPGSWRDLWALVNTVMNIRVP
jgi:hypothetical protein